MLSILIPTYNYNAFSLVNEIQKQAKEAGIEFEIICMDDGSKLFLPENLEINSLENCSFEILKNNVGRSAIRNLLAKKASFDNLLFLDSDTIPVENNFIINPAHPDIEKIKILNAENFTFDKRLSLKNE